MIRSLITCIFIVAFSAAVYAQTVSQQIANAPWNIKTVGRGVVWKSHQFTSLFNALQDVHVMEANLGSSEVTVRLPYSTGSNRKTVSTFAETLYGSAAVAVNAQFFDSAGSTQYFRVNNNLINDTNPGADHSGAIGVSATNAVSLLLRPSNGWVNVSRRDLMACGPVLVNDGVIQSFANTSFAQGRHPRTAVGITNDNKLLLVAVDGRSAASAGMSLPELAQVFTALGATRAINFDGGGSTTAWVRGEASGGVVNNPSDGQERTVTNAIAVIAPPADVILDTNKLAASGGWQTGTSAGDKFGPDYRFRLTEPVSDIATWTHKTLHARPYEVFAWWSQGSNRSTLAPYLISHTGGTANVKVNQQTGGGSWQSLGTYSMNRGNNTISMSCWTTSGFVVVADAIKVVAR